MDYDASVAKDGMIGRGGIVVFDDTTNMATQAKFAMEFCSIESCGKCTPCRIGSTRGVEVIDKLINDQNKSPNVDLLNDLCNTLSEGSLCEMVGMTTFPENSALHYFPKDFNIKDKQKNT